MKSTLMPILKTIKKLLSKNKSPNQKPEIPILSNVIDIQEDERFKLEEEIDDMLKELDNMPRTYRIRRRNHPFLDSFLRQVDSRNLIVLYSLRHKIPLITRRPSEPMICSSSLTGEYGGYRYDFENQ